jgi:hypothetical protein
MPVIASGAVTALLAVESVVLVLLALVVVGLLRSHAEILRRLPADPDTAGSTTAPRDHQTTAKTPMIPEHLPAPRADQTPVVTIAGDTLDGGQLAIDPGKTDTLVAFLSSGCLTCKTFWDALQPGRRKPLPGDARPIIVVKDSAFESPSRLRELAPPDLPVVMSSQAWGDYNIAMSPYFLFVSGGTVRSEGAASSWEQVSSLLKDAYEDERIREKEAASGA